MSAAPDRSNPAAGARTSGRMERSASRQPGPHEPWLDRLTAACLALAPKPATATEDDLADPALLILDSLTQPPALTPRQRQQVSVRCGIWMDCQPNTMRSAIHRRAAVIVAAAVKDLIGLIDVGGPSHRATRFSNWQQTIDPVGATLRALQSALVGTTDVAWPHTPVLVPGRPGVLPRPPRADGAASQVWLAHLEAVWRFGLEVDIGSGLRIGVPADADRTPERPAIWAFRRGLAMWTGAPLLDAAATGYLVAEDGWSHALSQEAWRIMHQLVLTLDLGETHG